jgi:beta-lactamase regulating signal transducer with metallopeptidase domain
MEAFANPVVLSMATAFLSSLWQGIVIAFTVSICLKLVPLASAASRFAAWAAGSVAVASLPILPFLVQVVSRSNLKIAATGLPGSTGSPLIQLDLRWSVVIVGLWGAAAAFRAFDLAMHSLRLRKLWKSATPIEVSKRLATTLTGLGRGHVQICSTNMLERPSVIGFFAPRILIPEWLLEKLTATELEQIVLHEGEHLRRWDDWINLVQRLFMVVFPLNPALWWMERNLCREREMACDEGVVRVTHAPRAYAACLASLAERGFRHRVEALSLGAWQHRSELAHRVHGILLRRSTLHPVASATLLGALGCGLVACSVELARSPQLVAFVPAQKTENTISSASALGDAVFNDKRNLASGIGAVEARAVIPARRPAIMGSQHAQPKGRMSKFSAQPVHKTESGPDSTAIAKVTKLRDPNREDEQPQMILFTSFHQIGTDAGTAARSGQATDDFDSGVSGDSVVSDRTNNDASGSRVRSQITITRLILRILPPASFPVQPDAASFRNGWLVIQL